jgi:hypothetical protein
MAAEASMLWPNGIVPYVIDENFSIEERAIIASVKYYYLIFSCSV